jgi:hypothetical protein
MMGIIAYRKSKSVLLSVLELRVPHMSDDVTIKVSRRVYQRLILQTSVIKKVSLRSPFFFYALNDNYYSFQSISVDLVHQHQKLEYSNSFLQQVFHHRHYQ